MSTGSNGGPEPGSAALPPDWDRLEDAVSRLLEEHDAMRDRLQAANERVRELEDALSAVTSGDLDPVALSEQVELYERDNRALMNRLSQARAAIERIQARLQFLEDDR